MSEKHLFYLFVNIWFFKYLQMSFARWKELKRMWYKIHDTQTIEEHVSCLFDLLNYGILIICVMQLCRFKVRDAEFQLQ